MLEAKFVVPLETANAFEQCALYISFVWLATQRLPSLEMPPAARAIQPKTEHPAHAVRFA